MSEPSNTEVTDLEARLLALQNAKVERDERRRVEDLKKRVEAEELDAKAEDIADKLAADGAGKRGVDFEVVTAHGSIFAFSTPPGPAWEKFQGFVSQMITKDEPVPVHEYRNLAKSSLIERSAAGYEDLAKKAAFDAACAKYAALPNKVYLTLSDLADGKAKRRAGK